MTDRKRYDPELIELCRLLRKWGGKSLDQRAMKPEMSPELWEAWESTVLGRFRLPEPTIPSSSIIWPRRGDAMSPRNLTEPFIKALKPAPAGQRYARADALVPGLKVRVTDKGSKSFILWRRYGGAAHPAARSLGAVGTMTLAEARDKARSWLALIKQGEDPRGDASAGDDTFGAVVEQFFKHHVAKQRQGAGVERLIRKELLPGWRNKPLAKIDRRDVIAIVDEINGREAKYQARAVLAQIKVFFGWAIERGHVQASPADRLKPSRLIGPASARQRVLTDDELAAFWRAARRMQYPIGPLFRMLLLTGQRRSEVAEARWCEFDLDKKLWTIPPERFKTDVTHTVPLSDDTMALLKTLP
jgi:Arm DNA-binding domain/Phage integrase central domain/Phage integrase family